MTDQPRNVLDFVTLQLSKLNWRVAAIVGGAVFVLLIASLVIHVARHHQAADPTANLPQATYQPPQAGDTLPLPAAPAHH